MPEAKTAILTGGSGFLGSHFIKGLSKNPEDNSKIENEVRNEVVDLCSNFPIYKNLNK